ncbi:52 kDa repressor of the inhibitor of the protein kinase-like [Hydra vulgaris]|uniref:52 kDa repressor of the inhibitor of the protein kinase-like n=1 Tax=Hydra vulgaris TaxID=6087 RepID=UPI0032EA798E
MEEETVRVNDANVKLSLAMKESSMNSAKVLASGNEKLTEISKKLLEVRFKKDEFTKLLTPEKAESSTVSKEEKNTPELLDEIALLSRTPTSFDNVADHPLEINIELKLNRSNDIGQWGELSNDDVSFCVTQGPNNLQNLNNNFRTSKQNYNDHDPTKELKDWKNASSLLKSHENSTEHREALMSYLVRRSDKTLDGHLEDEIRKEQKYWRKILERVVAVISTLIEGNLAFRGSNERFGIEGSGNFIGLLELVAKFDPFLAEHIKNYGHAGSGHTSYLSKTVYDELVSLMAKKVIEAIVGEVKKLKYYGISVDFTPDTSHKDQLCVVVRYIEQISFEPIERFLQFVTPKNHTGETLADTTVDFLTVDAGLNFSDCRSQAYDNAYNMTGKYKGIQTKILEKNNLAKFLPCAGHSLNLVGSAGAGICINSVNFFGIIELIYNFFSASKKRWSVLEKNSKYSVKNLSKTRWTARADSVRVILNDYKNIINSLAWISEDENFDSSAQAQAQNILFKMEEFEFVLQTIFWNTMLQRMNAVSKSLQDSKITLDTACKLLSSLVDFILGLRESFDKIEAEAKVLLPDVDYKLNSKRQRIKKTFYVDTQPSREIRSP